MAKSILEQIREQNAAKAAANPPQMIKSEEIAKAVKGHGFDKKSLTKQQSQINRVEAASMKSAEARVAAELASQHLKEATEETLASIQKNYAKGIGITLDPSQQEALHGLLTNRYAILIGPAGSGKTTTIREFIKQLMEETELTSIACAAFTGRAVQQMKRALPETLHGNCSTIHMLLGFVPTEYEEDVFNNKTGEHETVVKWGFKPTYDESNKLPFDTFIFDEASMIPTKLWNQFIAACKPGVRIILIGDINQLPPVMDRSVLGFAMNVWPVFELRKIHRQSEGNAIIDNAHRVLHGEMPVNAENFHIIGTPPGKVIAPSGMSGMQVAAIQWLKRLADLKRWDPIRDTFIVPQNKSLLGQLELNPHLMTMFNPPREENGIVVNKRIDIHTGTERAPLAIGDKMMVLSNINNVSPPITNGMVGVIKSITLNGKYDQKRSQMVGESEDIIDLTDDFDTANFNELMDELNSEKEPKEKESRDQRQASHITTIEFEDGRSLACATAGDYRRIGHAYAITCHKAQGGEYPNVVVLIHSANNALLSREWLYTALTRARENVYIFANAKGLQIALRNQCIKGKTLQEKIASYNLESAKAAGKGTFEPPVLWEPKKLEIQEAAEQ